MLMPNLSYFLQESESDFLSAVPEQPEQPEQPPSQLQLPPYNCALVFISNIVITGIAPFEAPLKNPRLAWISSTLFFFIKNKIKNLTIIYPKTEFD